MNVNQLLQNQRDFFKSQQPKNIDFRIEQLKRLKRSILENEQGLYEAMRSDFGKSEFDTFTTEISLVIKDIDYFVKNIKKLAKPRLEKTNITNLIGKSRIYPEPLGCVLVIGAWNYPFQLALSPLVAAVAAGNCVLLKPSEMTEKTTEKITKVIKEALLPTHCHVVTGGVEETTALLQLRFDKIFFTGSTNVGKIVYEAAAKHLTPVTLELGGKSPAIVSKHAKLEIAARRIVWGKFLNAGQTCIAPDYVLVDRDVKDDLMAHLKAYIEQFDYRKDVPQYTQIINNKNFKRLVALIDREKVVWGGEYEEQTRHITPTIVDNVTWEDTIMEEEIFGPILPIITYDDLEKTLALLLDKEKPLAAYLFSENSEEKDRFISTLSFGGGCINDVVMHVANQYLPFGGVGHSGMGRYHGKYGFAAFSHEKPILQKATWWEPMVKYPPYSESKLKWIKKLL